MTTSLHEQIENCWLCGAAPAGHLEIPGQVDLKTSYPYTWFACCSYFRQQPAIPEESLHKLYDADYSRFRLKGIMLKIYQAVIRHRARQNRHFIANKDVLDIGCGTGEFLHASKTFRPRSIMGIELSPHAAQLARDRYGLNVLCGPIESVEPGKRFDTIFMLHVIEHLPDPEKILRQCRTMLKEGGTLVLETPNACSLDRDFFGPKWVGFHAPFHTFVFSPTSLQKMLVRSGYAEITTRYHPLTNTFSQLPAFTFRDGFSITRICGALQFLLTLPFVSWLKRSGTVTVRGTRS